MKLPLILFTHFFILFLCASCHPTQLRQDNSQAEALILFEKGKQYEFDKDVRNALISYWAALDLLDTRQDTIQKAEVYIQLGDLLFKYGLYEKAVEHHRESYTLMKDLDQKEQLVQITQRLSIDYTLLNQPDTASYFLDLTNQLAIQMALPEVPSLLALSSDQIRDKIQSDSISSVYDREQLLNLETKYKREKEQYLREKARNRQLIVLLAFIITTGIFLFLLFIFYRKKKQAEQLREQQFAWFNTLVNTNKEQIKEYQRELFGSNTQINELRHQLAQANISLEETNRLKEELRFYMLQQEKIQTEERTLRLRDELLLSAESTQAVLIINRMKQKPTYNPIKSPKEWQILIDFINVLYDNYSQIVLNLEGLTDRDREICFLIKLGFSTGQLAIFYGISPGSLTKAKFRIRKKLDGGNINKTSDTCSA